MLGRCPYHQLTRIDGEGKCPLCVARGLRVVTCEIDKIGRVIDGENENGRELDRHSYAVLVFGERPATPGG